MFNGFEWFDTVMQVFISEIVILAGLIPLYYASKELNISFKKVSFKKVVINIFDLASLVLVISAAYLLSKFALTGGI